MEKYFKLEGCNDNAVLDLKPTFWAIWRLFTQFIDQNIE